MSFKDTNIVTDVRPKINLEFITPHPFSFETFCEMRQVETDGSDFIDDPTFPRPRGTVKALNADPATLAKVRAIIAANPVSLYPPADNYID